MRTNKLLYHFMNMRLVFPLVALIISACAVSDEWVFIGSDKASILKSISEFIDEQNGIYHIPRYRLLTKIDAYECGNPYFKLCVKSTLDTFDYACSGRVLSGLTRMQIELKARSIPEFNCSEKAWYNKSSNTDAASRTGS
ncbi:hypothetical protein [Shewanella marisflavi]|uniref:hypothetical protein n=1 Tax=Shewanella marisflavi TaxID=260364 RepID=UPI003AAC6558